MILELPFREFRDEIGAPVYWVMLDVRLSKVGASHPETMAVSCVIDSGASHCVFDEAVAGLLNLDLNAACPRLIQGIDGLAETWVHEIALHLPGGPVRIDAHFKKDLGVAGLLGIAGFFEHFNVSFNAAGRRCILDRAQPSCGRTTA